MEIKIRDKMYYMNSDEWEKIQKFYNILLYGKESLS